MDDDSHADKPLSQPLALQGWEDVKFWRKGERERLIAARLAKPAEIRAVQGQAIAAAVLAEIGDIRDGIVSAYWPFRAEPDMRSLLDEVNRRGGHTALPVVLEKGRPLEFHLWRSGEALSRGVWNIPIPAESRPCVPDVVIAPVVGYDPGCYRLGYGGGFFDRTLAFLQPRPRVIGVGYSDAKIASIHPQPHDIPMDMIVVETGILRPQP
ncbi:MULTISPECIES: 5-formyltetrahydrofolate cyclo-ligase [unclassified Rhizobium]|uniref:5-formyltetrahydrofolate cyclo-ligase n=1 Tax=unclassified Rhizobium TaxID=2613769 RepID=UPI000713676D|nr:MULTISPECIES: 5-formyltetrahydrofolate cyclo-ligase [unclassified Rhizobium]KQS88258.1 5-formyltetrahydrofolate cyclo-ligase [Rhizobium sp. Leaf391]KQT00755.1 5-formyltetrahydrofolate cyclo-ligase [Rhizobium sp. Leaf386]KQU09228.1 5-formyltetrahydrofolate cyclo-ligase [Rhizobium sp. Leaf453]